MLDEQLSINGTLPRTLAHALLRPGFLTTEYRRGRIASYIAPFRLYLFASVTFFLLLSLRGRLESTPLREGRRATPPIAADTAVERPQAAGQTRFGVFIDDEEIEVHTGIDALDRAVTARLKTMRDLPADEAGRRIVSRLIEQVPTAMFVLLPIFALILKLLYIRHRRFYTEHFVFALHYHAFAFLMFTIMLFLPDLVGQLLLLWLLAYLFLAMKRVYAQGVVRTLIKLVLVVLPYLLTLSITLASVVIIGVLTL